MLYITLMHIPHFITCCLFYIYFKLEKWHHSSKHLDNFLQGKRFHNQQEAKNAFQELVESQSTGFYATRINKLISRWQKCVDGNGSYFD